MTSPFELRDVRLRPATDDDARDVAARRFYERHGFEAVKLTDGQGNEERCPDVLHELRRS